MILKSSSFTYIFPYPYDLQTLRGGFVITDALSMSFFLSDAVSFSSSLPLLSNSDTQTKLSFFGLNNMKNKNM